MKNLLIVGFGNIGFYHFLSLFNQKKYSIKFYLVDKDKQNFLRLKKFDTRNIFTYTNISILPKIEYDLLILSTSSNERFYLFKQLVKNFFIKYIIFEKFVFNSVKESIEAKKIINKKKLLSWVNCNYQTIPFFKKLNNETKNKKFEMRVFGGNWSLGTSAIHFLDLFVYLSNSKISKFKFISNKKKLYNTKRKGYYEFDGKYECLAKNGSFLSIEKFNSSMPLVISIFTDNYFLNFIDNLREVNLFSKDNNWKIKKFKINFPLQSQLTSEIFDEIITSKKSSLPSFKTSIENHILILKALTKELNNTKIYVENKIMIT